jgi:hypothetical protein
VVLPRFLWWVLIRSLGSRYHEGMDTASQIVRAKYAELFAGELDLPEFSAWIDALPIPAMVTADFKPFIQLVIGAQCRLTLWLDGAPEPAVIASLQRLLNQLDHSPVQLGPDPLYAHKLRYVRNSCASAAKPPLEFW